MLRDDLDGEMRQDLEAGKTVTIVTWVMRIPGHYRDDGGQMPWSNPPQMQIVEAIAVDFDCLAELVREARVGIHVEQNSTGVPHQSVGPTRDDTGADDTGQGVHPEPAKCPGEQEADDHED